MDNSTVQSRTVSSSAANSTNQEEFVNQIGEAAANRLALWNQTRQQWVGNGRTQEARSHIREPRISWNATYESLLGTNKPLRKPVPLFVSLGCFAFALLLCYAAGSVEMVDFLVDVWEEEGLYDS